MLLKIKQNPSFIWYVTEWKSEEILFSPLPNTILNYEKYLEDDSVIA